MSRILLDCRRAHAYLLADVITRDLFMPRPFRAFVALLAVLGLVSGTMLHAQATNPASHDHHAAAGHGHHHPGPAQHQDGNAAPGDCPMVHCTSILCPALADRQPQRLAFPGDFRPVRELLVGFDPQPDLPPPRCSV